MYGTGHNMAYSYQMVVPSTGDAQQVLARLQQTHLSYLQQDEGGTKLSTRRDLEALITNHLTSVPHKEKFPCPKFLEILRRSIEDRSDFNACKAGQAFEALEGYAVNLLSQPWRAEFRCIRLYSGFYTHQVEAHLSGARDVLHLMGYVMAEDNEMRLNEPIDPDRVIDVSLNCLIASVECKLMMKIMEATQGSCAVREVAYVRRHNLCNVARAADILLKRDTKLSTTSSNHHHHHATNSSRQPRSANTTTAAAEWRTGVPPNRSNRYVHVERLLDPHLPWPDDLDLHPVGSSGSGMAADERCPPNYTSWDRHYVPTPVSSSSVATAANGHYNSRPVTHGDHVTAAPEYARVRRQSSDPRSTTTASRQPNEWEFVYDKVKPHAKDLRPGGPLPSIYNGREIASATQPVPPPRRDPNGYTASQLRRKTAHELSAEPLPRQFFGADTDSAEVPIRRESVPPSTYALQKRIPDVYSNSRQGMLLPSRMDHRMTPVSAAAATYQCHPTPPLYPAGYLYGEHDPYGNNTGSYYPYSTRQPCPVIVPNHVCRTQVAYPGDMPPFLMGGLYCSPGYDPIGPTAFPVVSNSGYTTVRGGSTAADRSRELNDVMQSFDQRDGGMTDPTKSQGSLNRRSLYDNVNADDPTSNSAFVVRGSGRSTATAEIVTPLLSTSDHHHNLHQARKENPTTIYGSSIPKVGRSSVATTTGDEELFATPASNGGSTLNAASSANATSSTNTARRDYNGVESRRSAPSITATSVSKLLAPPPSAGPTDHNGTSLRSTTPLNGIAASSTKLTNDDRRVGRSASGGSETVPPRRRGSSSSGSLHERSPSVGSQRSAAASTYSSASSDVSWDCIWCTYMNSGEHNICEMCSRSRVRGAESKTLSSGGQQCQKCTLVNDKDSRQCSACNESLKNSPTYV